MARKTKTIAIAAEGRDKGKVFLATEMSALQAEKWATRALLAISRSGVELSDDVLRGGMAGLLVAGIRAVTSLSFEDAEPLLDEMMGCVQIVPDPARPAVVRPLVESDAEEVATILLLRSEVIELHTGFSIAAELSNLGRAFQKKAAQPDTSTSPEPSEPLSAAA